MFSPYSPSFQMPYQQLQQPTGLQFVNGIESARMYQLPPNSKQILMDKEKARFYLVEADASGQKSVQAFDFTAVQDQQPQFATQAQLEELRAQYESLVQQISQLTNQAAQSTGVYGANEPARREEPLAANDAERANHARPTLPTI